MTNRCHSHAEDPWLGDPYVGGWNGNNFIYGKNGSRGLMGSPREQQGGTLKVPMCLFEIVLSMIAVPI